MYKNPGSVLDRLPLAGSASSEINETAQNDALFLDKEDRVVLPESGHITTRDQDFNERVFTFMQNVFELNGLKTGKTLREDVIHLPEFDDSMPMSLFSSYRGLTDEQVRLRQPFLEEFAVEQHRLKHHGPGNEARWEARDKLINKLTSEVREQNGHQGLEQFAITLSVDKKQPKETSFPGSRLGSFIVSRSYNLPNESTTYNLPGQYFGKQLYPYLGEKTPTFSHINGRRVDTPRDRIAVKLWLDSLRGLVQ